MALSLDRCGRCGAAVAEEAIESHADGCGVVLCHAEGGGCETDLFDEVGELGLAEAHELVDFVHGGFGCVGVEAGHALHRAAEEGAKELVQVGEEEAEG